MDGERWTEKDDYEHAAIVNQLRSQGWGRNDAIERADTIMAERIERRARPLPHSKEGGKP